jgi:hypothetical protein
MTGPLPARAQLLRNLRWMLIALLVVFCIVRKMTPAPDLFASDSVRFLYGMKDLFTICLIPAIIVVWFKERRARKQDAAE